MASSSSSSWYGQTFARLAREPADDEDPLAWGQRRWAWIVNSLRRAIEDAPGANRSLQALSASRTDMSLRKLAFEPQRSTLYVEGRPVQVSYILNLDFQNAEPVGRLVQMLAEAVARLVRERP